MRPPQCAVWVQRKQGCPCRGAKTVVLPRGHTRGLCLLPRPDSKQILLLLTTSYQSTLGKAVDFSEHRFLSVE